VLARPRLQAGRSAGSIFPMHTTSSTDPCAALTVLYDGACPLCRREVGVYRGLAPLQPLAWQDVSQPRATLPAGHTRAGLLARFHVRRADGQMLDGAAAFVALWSALPGWRWLARLAALPGATPLLELAYRAFLRLRPHLQGIARAFEPPALPREMVAELRSDHAGETGAVWIYRGVLALARDPALRDFARRHRATESEHLRLIAAVLPWPRRSRLLVPWRLAGFATGALPALFGPRAVYATIAAVETFVDRHYAEQIEHIDGLLQKPTGAADKREAMVVLRADLQACREDEVRHRDEALAAGVARGLGVNLWTAAVANGSAAAVSLARRI